MDSKEMARSDAYPMVFAGFLPLLKEVARRHGYALAVHGSMARDLDLIACPWTAEATDAPTLVEALRVAFNGFIRDERHADHNPCWKEHGRLAWSIYFREEGGPYIDLSVMPRRDDYWDTIRPILEEKPLTGRTE